MVKNPIKVYGRVKPVLNKNQAEEYEIHDTADDFQTLNFNLKPHGFFNAKPESLSFRFQKVFNTSNQEEVFSIVAKPVVDSVLQGYNGTIFAYGQTGSGKTYSMTGGLSRYEDRGVIPRTIQHIFKHFLEAGLTHSTFISYLEIYNECGYDLLNPNHKVSKLDDLP
ncbi:kinesin-like protein KIF6 [Frankliniella occidentalis]|uniref:Kinesin-like protein KIF6 n=1 Tax=Frankliniella occidentalis TaxID=133901 RepID=A0A6J1RSB4_FRAOC|nr:kinesin-like protein KIF6 [Frankliniella occidentalis]